MFNPMHQEAYDLMQAVLNGFAKANPLTRRCALAQLGMENPAASELDWLPKMQTAIANGRFEALKPAILDQSLRRLILALEILTPED